MRLILMRHAQTEVGYDKEDFDRVLTDIGKGEAEQAGNFLDNYQIEKVLSSSAKRAVQTCNIITEQISAQNIEIVHELYEGDEERIIDLLSTQEDHDKHILVIGHNPLIYNLALELADENDSKYNDFLDYSMPTACIIVMEFRDIYNWQQIRDQKAKILAIFNINRDE